MQGAGKVGALILIFVVMLIGAYTVIGKSLVEPKANLYYALLSDAGGIPTGTKVLVAGVKVGEVTKIELKGPAQAQITMRILESYKVTRGSTVLLPTSLIGFGESPISIVPPADPNAPALPPNDPAQPLAGTKAGALDNILPNSKETMAELTATMKAMRKLLEDGGLKADVEKLLKTSDSSLQKFGILADKFGKVSDQTSTLMADNRGAINSAVKSAALAMNDIQTTTKMLAKIIQDGTYQNEAKQLLQGLNKTVAHADTLVADLDTFVNDPKLRGPMAQSMANVAKMTESGTVIAKNTEEITKNGITLSAKAIQLADKANDIADEAKGMVKKVGGFFNKTGPKPPQIHLSMDLLYESRPAYWRTDIEASTIVGDQTYYLGLFDAFESNKITAQAAKTFGPTELRYGVYASKPGIGVNYRLAPKLGFRSDLYDINDPKLNLRLSYEVRDGIVGWVGFDRIFKNNVPTIGFGVRK